MTNDLIRITLNFFFNFLTEREIYITYVNSTIRIIFIMVILHRPIDFTYFNLVILILIFDVIIAVCHRPLK